MADRKSPVFAFLLSLVVPGLGQFYTNEPMKGVLIAGTCLTFAWGMWWLSGLNRISLGLAFVIVWVSAILDASKAAQAFGQLQDWYFRRAYVVAMLLLVGPLALPLLWRSPYFSRVARWGWTGVVTLGVLLFLTTPYLLAWLVQRIPEFRQVLSAF